MNVKIKSRRALDGEPVFIKSEGLAGETISGDNISGDSFSGDSISGAASLHGQIFPAAESSRMGERGITAVVTAKAGEELDLTLSSCQTGIYPVKFVEGTDCLDVYIGGEKFTSYNWSREYAKPYLGPVYTSFGKSFTRLDFETKEHPHHRSVFLGIGDVRLSGDEKGVDFWNEPSDRGIQRQASITGITETGAYGSFTANNIWMDCSGRPMIDESRAFTFYSQSPLCRYVDLEFTFRASYGEVIFGATKEAGPLGVRVNDKLRGDRGGRMVNSYGAVSEAECWGRPANWCDYGGELDGHDVGVAVFDNEQNERYPTSWHIRDYGLFAANNLYFKGPLTIRAGESLTYRYRLVFREGERDLAGRFIEYADQYHISK